MKNENCLKDVMCPECGSTEAFRIKANVWVEVRDEGADPMLPKQDIEWDGESFIDCGDCGNVGRISEFSHPGFYVTFDVVTEESAEHGEADRRGWWGPGGWEYDDKPESPAYSFDPDDFDVDEHADLGGSIVEWAVKLLRDEGATHFSGSDWFSTEPELDIHDGSRLTRSFHFHGFSDELMQRVIEEVAS